ncbi:hypothetical protein OVY01_22215 [Robbsia sp. Bb-Pol-6]|uniref:Polymerase nucleotidyl transferase domain-containing protein n=1 Tax=Robbsia betulipollinis TaxID=2981849 RepID=A0ABT3ZTH8_9BURK|nr:nucleotidyltransferase domain-containing protein [Robbsia betulipollinis]MCY0389859.1 hypothetical protein [Robbsia betulipollinis]
MTASEIAAHLLGTCASLEHFDAYMFGSTLHGIGQDIDILIVGPGGDLLAKLKKEIQCAGESLPLHMLYMQPSEERHTKFVARESCIPLKQLISSVSQLSRSQDANLNDRQI